MCLGGGQFVKMIERWDTMNIVINVKWYIFEFDSVRLQPYSNRIGINRKKTMGFS